MSNTLDPEAQAVVDDLNVRLDRTVATVVEAIDTMDTESAYAALGLALLVMPEASLTDIAFSAVLRLAEQGVANRE